MSWSIQRFLIFAAVLFIFALYRPALAQDVTVSSDTPVTLTASSNPGAPTNTPCGPDNSSNCSGGTLQPNGNINWTVDGSPASVGSITNTVKSSSSYCSADDNVNYYTYCYSYWDESTFTALLAPGDHVVTASIPASQDPSAAFTRSWTVRVTAQSSSTNVCAQPANANLGSIKIIGSEGVNSSTGAWDSNSITVSINGSSKTVSYGQFSTPGSIASAIGALFSSDCNGPALAQGTADGNLYIKVRHGGTISQLCIDNHGSASFSGQMSSSINPSTITANIDATQLYLGQSTNVNVQVSCNSACGQVAYLVDGTQWATVPLDASGHAVAATPAGIAAGTHQVTVKFLGSSSYMESISNAVSFNTSSSSTPAGIYSYFISSYDANGNVQAYADSVNGSWSDIGYDTLDRIKAATRSVNASTQNFCWSYDSFGNRLAQVISGSSCNNPPPAVSYNANNQILGADQHYDAAGHQDKDGTNEYLYDAEGRICAVRYPISTMPGMTGLVGYIYDAEGRRVAKGTLSSFSCDLTPNPNNNGLPMNGFQKDAGYILGLGGEQVSETDGGGNWVHTNVYANGELIATYTPTGVNFHLNDWLGTRRMDTDASGSPGPIYQSYPFGELVPGAPTITSPEHFFTGKERDSNSGLDYFGARHYASSMGRFMSPDWSAVEEPVPYSKLDDPQTLNLYGYVGNNPLSRVDADGHEISEALEHFRNVLAQTTVKVTFGFGYGRKGNLGPAEGRYEAALKGNVAFSNGKISVSTSIEAGVSAGLGAMKSGLGGSAEKTAATVDLNGGTVKAGGATSTEYVVGLKTGGTSTEGSKDGFSFNAEVGDGLLGGGGVSLTTDGVKEFKQGVQELINTLLPGPPPPPPPPAPGCVQSGNAAGCARGKNQ